MSCASESVTHGKSATAASSRLQVLRERVGRQVVERDCVFNTKRADRRALERRHHGAGAQRLADIAAERADVRAAAAFDVQLQAPDTRTAAPRSCGS